MAEPSTVENIIGTLLNVLFPLKMLLRLYSLCILMIDIIWVMVNTVFAIFQSLYELIRPPPLKPVRQETALVIGAGRGVGKEIAIQIANLGAIVICVDKNKSNNEHTVQTIKNQGGSSVGYACDITKRDNVEELAAQIRNDLGFLIDEFLPAMKDKNRGHIIALTSVAGLSYLKDQMPLSVAQFAVQGLAESMMEDLRMNKIDGVFVTLIHIYPFIADEKSEVRLRIPSYFGTTTPSAAAKSILESVRRNYPEASVPKHLLCLGHLLRILPRKATVLIRDLLDTGVDFA